MKEPMLNEVVTVAARFRRSASLEADYGQADLLKDYIVSPLAARGSQCRARIETDIGSEGHRFCPLVYLLGYRTKACRLTQI